VIRDERGAAADAEARRAQEREAREAEAGGALQDEARAAVTVRHREIGPATVQRVAAAALDANERLDVGTRAEEEEILLDVEEEPVLGLAVTLDDAGWGRRRRGLQRAGARGTGHRANVDDGWAGRDALDRRPTTDREREHDYRQNATHAPRP